MCCQEAFLLGWLSSAGLWAGSTPAHLPLLCYPRFIYLLCYPRFTSQASQYGLSVPGYCVGVFSKARQHSLGPRSDLRSDGSTAFPEHGASQGAKISLLSCRNCTEARSDVIWYSGSPELPTADSLYAVPLESTLHSQILMFLHFSLVWKNCFHYFLFAQGM